MQDETAKWHGQVAVVTGAGRGIGRCIAEMLGRGGARVIAVARTRDEIEATATVVRESGAEAEAIPTDIREEAGVVALFAAVMERFGKLDVLINNAGMGRFGALADLSVADFDDTVAVNLRGTFLCCRAAMGLMVPARCGTIINIASVVGVKGYPDQSAYTAAKHGVMGLTKSLAVEAQPHGIRVSAVLPGGVDTRLVRDARPDLDVSELMHPEDVAQAVAYLLSLSDRAAVDQLVIRRRNASPF